MKTETTRKNIKSSYDTVLICNELNYLLSYTSPRFYNAGGYGWNWDAYSFGETVIIKGYRNFPQGVSVSYELQKEYNEKAYNIISDNNICFEKSEQLVSDLIKEFIKKAIEE